VHFHIGASVTGMTFFGQYPWDSHPENTKLAIGGTLLFIGNARVVTNLILSGMFDRHPNLKMVSVESGVGWIPFILETLDYEMAENAPEELAGLEKMPSEYFRSNLYATFWFENNRNKLPELIEAVGEDSILFETDFPHPTCLYPKPLEAVADKMSTLPVETQRKIFGENARELYRL
jgi:predicted TIM-barrel fold metal-dependent hydrolase